MQLWRCTFVWVTHAGIVLVRLNEQAFTAVWQPTNSSFSRQISRVHHEQGRYKHAARKQNLWFTINIVLQIEKIQDKTFGVASGKFQTKKWWNEPSLNPLLSLLPTPPLSVLVSPHTVSALFLPPFSTHLLSRLHVSFPASQPLSNYSYELWREL